MQKTNFTYSPLKATIFLLILFLTEQTIAQTAFLVKDLQTFLNTDISSPLSEAVELNGFLYFTATTQISGSELWKTDGTTIGTTMVKDIVAGTSPSMLGGLTLLNGSIFFFGNNHELWKTDGSASNTVIVKDLAQYCYGIRGVSVCNNQLIFADTGNGTNNLWKSDGTSAGTSIIHTFTDTTNTALDIYRLISIGNITYFIRNDSELWKTDGTNVGTNLVKTFYQDSAQGAYSLQQLTSYNGQLFFVANDEIHGMELWKSDGTSVGTTLVKDINDNINNHSYYYGDSSSFPQDFHIFNNSLYFTANDGEVGYELWKSDGTTAGTTLVKDFSLGFLSGGPSQMTDMNGELYVAANGGTGAGEELWKGNGFGSSFVQLKDISPGASSSDIYEFFPFGNALFFRAEDYNGNPELWKTDGTSAGTILVKEINNTWGSYPASFHTINQKLLFKANDNIHGQELWVTDGTSANTLLLKDINGGTASNSIGNMININGNFLFAAKSPAFGSEIWQTDGTNAGTQIFKDIIIGTQNSFPSNFYLFNNELYFSANAASAGVELWKSDGTAAGTAMLKDLITGAGGSSPNCFAEMNGFLYFGTINTQNGREGLWKTDGTSAGTILIMEFNYNDYYNSPKNLININGTLFFAVNEHSNAGSYPGWALWKSDGTTAGTTVIKYFTDSHSHHSFTNLNGSLYFVGSVYGQNSELWKSDGTTAGTLQIKSVNIIGQNSLSYKLLLLNGNFYFSANDSTNGTELWKSDGTTMGTALVKDIFAGSSDASPEGFTIAGNSFYFFASDEIHGKELWKSDGTLAGTTLVKDIFVGAKGSTAPYLPQMNYFFVVNDTLYFAANEGINGYELWRSDGTAAGTALLADISPTASSAPRNYFYYNKTLYFTANHEDYGDELWGFGFPNTLSAPSPLQKSNFSIYPNPAHSLVNIKGDFSPNTHLILYNSIGEKMLSETITKLSDNCTLNISAFPTGIYFLNISNEKENVSYKVVKE